MEVPYLNHAVALKEQLLIIYDAIASKMAIFVLTFVKWQNGSFSGKSDGAFVSHLQVHYEA
ncbi:hypothetical protein [Nostoc commune]|uniref:hypothetical protein n=1 Tax=Nostoc commune TaxID=1178 RepID=UPI0011B1C6D9|nr:hypothetical protein [Nostoc commune]